MITYEEGPRDSNVLSVERQMRANALWALTCGR